MACQPKWWRRWWGAARRNAPFIVVRADGLPLRQAKEAGTLSRRSLVLILGIAWLLFAFGIAFAVYTINADYSDTKELVLVSSAFDIRDEAEQIGAREEWATLAWAAALNLTKTRFSPNFRNERAQSNHADLSTGIFHAIQPQNLRWNTKVMTVTEMRVALQPSARSFKLSSAYVTIPGESDMNAGWEIDSSCLSASGVALDAWREELKSERWPKYSVVGIRQLYFAGTTEGNTNNEFYISALTMRSERIEPELAPSSGADFNSMWTEQRVGQHEVGIKCQGSFQGETTDSRGGIVNLGGNQNWYTYAAFAKWESADQLAAAINSMIDENTDNTVLQTKSERIPFLVILSAVFGAFTFFCGLIPYFVNCFCLDVLEEPESPNSIAPEGPVKRQAFLESPLPKVGHTSFTNLSEHNA